MVIETNETDAPKRMIDEAGEQLLFKAYEQVEKMQAAELRANAALKLAKAQTADAVESLNYLIREFKTPGLFTPQVDAEWRQTTLLEMGMPEPILEKLAAHNPSIKTWGDIADFTSDEANRLTNIKGIGEGKAAEIEAVLDAWLKDHPQPVTDDDDLSDCVESVTVESGGKSVTMTGKQFDSACKKITAGV